MTDFQLIQWRGPTAPPPQLPRIDPNTLTLMREHMINVHALYELTGVPTLYRWGRAIWERRPIHEVEQEYFERIYRQLPQLGAAPARLEVQPQLRGVVPIDYIAEGRHQPPVQASQIVAPDMPEDFRRKMQMMGVPTSAEDVAAQVAGRSMVLAMTAAPAFAGMTKETAKQLAKIAAAGFGVGGTGAAGARIMQGFPEEAPRAFFEVGLASTVVADVANALRVLAAGASAPQLRAVAHHVLRRRQESGGLAWRDFEGEAFVREIEEALLALKRGDTSKYDSLLRRMEEWQKKVEEFQKLYEARQKGGLSPEDEARYAKLLRETAQIRDRYDLLKQYIETARELGLEAGARRAEFERRTVEDLARAVQEMPPGPPRKDLMQWLQRVDIDFLQKLARDQNMLVRYARRFGVDEQTLAERASLMLKERQWERLAELPSEELKKILMDETLLKRRASELGVAEDRLRALIEDALQRRMGVKPAPEPQPERPPIERLPPKRDQSRLPETEGAVVTREGQVLIVRPKEGAVVARLEELPDVKTRLRALLRRRLQTDDEVPAARAVKEAAAVRASDEQMLKTRVRDESADVRVGDAGGQAPRVGGADEQVPKVRAEDEAVRVADEHVRVVDAAGRVALDRETLRSIVPALPAYVFSMPALTVLGMISRAVGAPLVLAPGLPKPLPREPFGKWLDRVFTGTGFSWRAVAAQKEAFVFA